MLVPCAQLKGDPAIPWMKVKDMRNARSQTPLVGRAQLRATLATPFEAEKDRITEERRKKRGLPVGGGPRALLAAMEKMLSTDRVVQDRLEGTSLRAAATMGLAQLGVSERSAGPTMRPPFTSKRSRRGGLRPSAGFASALLSNRRSDRR